MNGGEAGVFVVRYPDGRASGDAFVLFSSESEVERAMTKNKQPLGHRYVDIFKSTSKELEMVWLLVGGRGEEVILYCSRLCVSLACSCFFVGFV